MRSHRFTLCLILVYLAATVGAAPAAELSIRAGLGYDFLSQEYFVPRDYLGDSLGGSLSDSLLTDWELTRNYLDDIIGEVSVELESAHDRRWELHLRYEQTGDYIRPRLGGEWWATLGSVDWRGSAEAEGRVRHRGETDFGEDYFEGRLRNKLQIPLSPRLSAAGRLDLELVRFGHASEYALDYHRIGSKLGGELAFEDGSFVEAGAFAKSRHVPDSSDLTYLNWGLDGSAFIYYPSGELDLALNAGRKTYGFKDERDNHWRADLTGRNRLNLGRAWFSRQVADFELVRYDGSDPVSRDYSRLRLAAVAGLDWTTVAVAAGPAVELLTETDDEFDSGEDYFESGLRLDVDALRPGTVFVSAESTAGFRDQHDDDLQSDFWFERLMLIGDVRFGGHLTFNVLFSAEWEWHRQAQEDSRAFLLSSSLQYSF